MEDKVLRTVYISSIDLKVSGGGLFRCLVC